MFLPGENQENKSFHVSGLWLYFSKAFKRLNNLFISQFQTHAKLIISTRTSGRISEIVTYFL